MSFFRCCSYIAELDRQQSTHGTIDTTNRINSDNTSPLSDSSSNISDYLNGELSPNADPGRASDKSTSNGGILSSGDVSRAIFALSAAVDRLFEHAANTLHIEALLSFLQVSKKWDSATSIELITELRAKRRVFRRLTMLGKR